MNTRAHSHWPNLLTAGSLVLIGIFFWDRFLRVKHPVVHLSCFAYRDVNRNGFYDLADRPFGGLKVTLQRPNGRRVTRESNAAGFANFDMSLGSWNAEINRAGKYLVIVQPPEGCDVTSSNLSQVVMVHEREGSAVGLIALQTIDPVGLAPRLTVSGFADSSHDSANTILKVTGPDATGATVTTSNHGLYSFPASPGSWKLDFVPADGASLSRTVDVHNYPVFVSRPASDRLSLPPKPKLKIIGFDNLTTSGTLLEIPNGYEELNWRNWVATHQKFYEGNTLVNATVSAEYFAYTSSGHPATISSTRPFDFAGAYVGIAWAGGEQFDVLVTAWRGENEVYRDRFQAKTSGPVYFDADYRSITRLEFASEGYWQVILDDVAVRTE